MEEASTDLSIPCQIKVAQGNSNVIAIEGSRQESSLSTKKQKKVYSKDDPYDQGCLYRDESNSSGPTNGWHSERSGWVLGTC